MFRNDWLVAIMALILIGALSMIDGPVAGPTRALAAPAAPTAPTVPTPPTIALQGPHAGPDGPVGPSGLPFGIRASTGSPVADCGELAGAAPDTLGGPARVALIACLDVHGWLYTIDGPDDGTDICRALVDAIGSVQDERLRGTRLTLDSKTGRYAPANATDRAVWDALNDARTRALDAAGCWGG